MKKWIFAITFVILGSFAVFARPSIGVVGDIDYVLGNWLSESDISYLSLSLYDLEPYILDNLDVLIINSASKLEEGLVKNLKNYLRADGKIVVFSNVLANDLVPSTGMLDDGSIAYTMGVTELMPLPETALTLPTSNLPLEVGYTFTQRRANVLASFISGDNAVSFNDNTLIFGIPSLEAKDEENAALNSFFLQALKAFTLDMKVLEEAKQRIDFALLSEDTKPLYLEAESLKEALETMSVGTAYEAFDKALELYKNCYLYSIPSRTNETRAVWFRAPTSKYSITQSLDNMEKLGINVIFVETWWEGALLYPNGPVMQRPEFRGFDPLELIISEAHKRNIEVHAWLEVFFSGYQKPGELLEKHPEWAAVGSDGNIAVKAEDNKYFIEPSHIEAREFLISMFVDMVKTYDLDGLHLDYIRYPLGNPVPYSFSPYVKELFTKSTGLEFPTDTKHQNWPRFSKFKEEQVTTFVAELRERVLEIKPLQISAAVFPGNDALVNKNQNWPLWIEDNYLDFISLMLYSRSTSTVRNWIGDALKEIANKIPFYPALAAINIPEPELLLEQTLLIQEYNLPGVCYFAWNHFNEDVISTLTKGPFRNKAIR